MCIDEYMRTEGDANLWSYILEDIFVLLASMLAIVLHLSSFAKKFLFVIASLYVQ